MRNYTRYFDSNCTSKILVQTPYDGGYMFRKREKFALPQSMVAAIQLTQMMAEVLAGSTLTLFQVSVIAEEIDGQFGKDAAQRTVKTDCVFVDNRGQKRVAVAWVRIARSNGEWHPTYLENFIKLDDGTPHRMEFGCHTNEKPLTPPFVSSRDEKLSVPPVAPKLDYSRIH